jgi:hypothetical protein
MEGISQLKPIFLYDSNLYQVDRKQTQKQQQQKQPAYCISLIFHFLSLSLFPSFFLSFFLSFNFMCIGVLPTLCIWKGVWSPGPGVINSCELPCGHWELNLGLLELLPVFLTAEPPLQPLEIVLFKLCFETAFLCRKISAVFSLFFRPSLHSP